MNTPTVFCLIAIGSLGCSESFNPFPASDSGNTDSASVDAEMQDTPRVCPPLRCDTAPSEFLTQNCGTSACHGAERMIPGNDYETGDVFGRLVGLASNQYQPSSASPECASIPIIDPDNINNSMLLRKLRPNQGECGDRMPYDRVVSYREIDCIESWITRELCLRAGPDAGP